jgi:TRAP-type C4-dicarboxylate transport system substrate-binding protein
VGLSFSEVYTSLSTNLVQAIDNPIADMYHENFHEVTDYLCMTKDLVNVVSWNFSERVWQSLTPQEQKWVTETAVEIQPAVKAWSDKDDAAALESFKKEGIEIIETDLTGFADKIAANINTVLGGDKELIQLYKDIRAAQK